MSAARPVTLALTAGALLLLAASAGHPQGGTAEEWALRQYQTALSFFADGKYTEALRDFEAVYKSFPQSTVADDALVAIATYQLDRGGDLDNAQWAIDALFKTYNGSDATPFGHVAAGRLKLARARSAADIESALAEFERVPKRFPTGEAVPAAEVHRAAALHRRHQDAEALAAYRDVVLAYSGSIWAARAHLGSAASFVALGQPLNALRESNVVRLRFPGTDEAARALRLNTLLARLYTRKPSPAYRSTARPIGKLREVAALGIGPDDTLSIVSGGQRLTLNAKRELVLLNSPPIDTLLVDPWGRVVTVGDRVVHVTDTDSFALEVPKPLPKNVSRLSTDVKQEFWSVDPMALAAAPDEILAYDPGRAGIVRFSRRGQYLGTAAIRGRADVMIPNEAGNLLVLDRQQKQVAVLDCEWQVLSSIPARGAGYEMKDPVAIAGDVVGHIYVLDRDLPGVFVFRQGGQLVATFVAPEKTDAALRDPRALVVDSLGRLLVYDRGRQLIVTYD